MKSLYYIIPILVTISLVFLGFQVLKPEQDNVETIRVGVIAGPEEDLMQFVAKLAADKIKIQVVPFHDYVMPNIALAEGQIEANAFQHEPYLQATNQQRKSNLVSAGKTFLYPLSLYSLRWKHINDIPAHAGVGIPNDPSNEARALLLLQNLGLISLSSKNNQPSIRDIMHNPKNLKFTLLDGAQLPRALTDLDIAVINTNYAHLAGYKHTEHGLAQESKTSPYANIIAVRGTDLQAPWVDKLREAIQNPKVAAEAKRLFAGNAIPAW